MNFTYAFWTLLLHIFFLSSEVYTQVKLIPYRKGNIWGYANAKRDIIIPCQYEAARPFLLNLAKVKKNGKWGLITNEGEEFLACQYDIIYAASTEGRIIVGIGGDRSGHGGRWGFVPKYRRGLAIKLEYDLIRECGASGLLGIKQDGKWGTVNQFNKIIIPPQYKVEPIQNHRFTNSLNSHPYSSSTTSEKPQKNYQKIRFSKKLARVKKGESWGFVNASGNEAIPTIYSFVGEFSEGLVSVIKQDQQGELVLGFLDTQGNTIIPFQYDVIESEYRSVKFSEGLVAVAQKGKWGYVDKQNNLKISFKYSKAKPFREKRTFVKLNFSDLIPTQWLLIDSEGKEIYKLPKGDRPIGNGFENSFARIQSAQGFQYFLNKEGQTVGKVTRYHKIFPFTKTDFYDKTPLARVILKQDSVFFTGFINEKGEEVISLQYDYQDQIAFRHPFTRGWTTASLQGKWGVINARGKAVIDFAFEEIHLPYRFHHQQFFAEGSLAVKQQGLWGFISYRGKWLIPPKYEKAYNFSDGIALVKYQGKWGYINRKGQHFFED